MRITIEVTDEEYRKLKEAAGLVKLGPWIRHVALGEAGGVTVRAAERETQKISKPGVEVDLPNFGAHKTYGLPFATIPLKPEVTEPVKSGVRVCRHGAEQGAHCWQCRGIAEVEAPKKAKGRGKK